MHRMHIIAYSTPYSIRLLNLHESGAGLRSIREFYQSYLTILIVCKPLSQSRYGTLRGWCLENKSRIAMVTDWFSLKILIVEGKNIFTVG